MNIDFSKKDAVSKKLKELNERRSKPKYDPKHHVAVLQHILENIREARLRRDATISLIISLFQTSKRTVDQNMPRDTWTLVADSIFRLLDLLEAELSEDQNAEVPMFQGLVNFLDDLEQELHLAFQSTSHTTLEYVLRLKDEHRII